MTSVGYCLIVKLTTCRGVKLSSIQILMKNKTISRKTMFHAVVNRIGLPRLGALLGVSGGAEVALEASTVSHKLWEDNLTERFVKITDLGQIQRLNVAYNLSVYSTKKVVYYHRTFSENGSGEGVQVVAIKDGHNRLPDPETVCIPGRTLTVQSSVFQPASSTNIDQEIHCLLVNDLSAEPITICSVSEPVGRQLFYAGC